MKVNELMIDDWVHYKGKMPCRVVSIIGNSIKFDNGTPQEWMSDVENFTPIPITPEILEKNFESTQLPDDPYGAYFFGRNDYIEVYIKEYSDGLWQVQVDEVEMGGLPSWLMYVSNVHELQHALRLCGINKEITI